MTRTTAVLLCVVMLAGCGVVQRMAPVTGPNLSTFEAKCTATPFAEFGQCIRGELNSGYPRWHSDQHADLVDVYLAWLDAAGARVADGRMEEPEARLGAAEMKVRLKRIASERATNASLQQGAGISQMLTGLALINAAQPRHAYSPQIVCTSSEAVRGNITTICH